MLYSSANITNSTIDNRMNNVGVSAESMQLVDSGFIALNYQSQIRVQGTTVRGLVGQTSSFIAASGRSSVSVKDSRFEHNTAVAGSCISALSPPSFEFSGSMLKDSDGISIEGMTGDNTFLISDSQIFPIKAIPGIKISNSNGKVANSTFVSNATLGNADQTNSGLLISGTTSEVTIDNCSFINLTSQIGAGI